MTKLKKFTEKLMKYLILFLTIILGSMLFISCSDLKEDISTSVPELNVHADGVINPTSPNFHGNYFTGENPAGFSDCSQCHASDFSGGTANAACTDCHASIGTHKEGILDPNSPDFHGKFIANNLGWDMRDCGTCHSSDYSGGTASPSCLNCHTQEDGPEACNTCHGEFTDPTKIAPPTALNGELVTTYPGVGAHTAHLVDNNLGNDLSCSTCHKFPSSMYADGHLGNDNKAEIIFGELAIHSGVNPNYSFTNNTCSDTYCHGNFAFYKDSSNYAFVYTAATMVGNNVSVKWNQVDGSQAGCGSCHGLPPTGHIASTLTACINCHPGVVDNQGNIINRTKHMNGVKNVFGN